VSGFGFCGGIIAICILPFYVISAHSINGSDDE
jgi:hypothetical protein